VYRLDFHITLSFISLRLAYQYLVSLWTAHEGSLANPLPLSFRRKRNHWDTRNRATIAIGPCRTQLLRRSDQCRRQASSKVIRKAIVLVRKIIGFSEKHAHRDNGPVVASIVCTPRWRCGHRHGNAPAILFVAHCLCKSRVALTGTGRGRFLE
jgi:hypothetical protein